MSQILDTTLNEVPGGIYASQLLELADKYEASWPLAYSSMHGTRAGRAVDYVRRGKVKGLGNDENGNDLWRVAGCKCSKRGDYCECSDESAYTHPAFGRLCAHRLAIALKDNTPNQAVQRLVDLIVEQGSGKPNVRIIVRRDYEQNFVTLTGYHASGQSRPVKFAPDEYVTLTLVEIQDSLDAAGYGIMAMPQKLPGYGMEYSYRLARLDNGGVRFEEKMFWAKGSTLSMKARSTSRRLTLAFIAEHIEEVLSGPFKPNLTEHEAKRLSVMAQVMRDREYAPIEAFLISDEAFQQSAVDAIESSIAQNQ